MNTLQHQARQKMLLGFRTLLLVFLVFSEFFGFGVVVKADTACSATISFNPTSTGSTVTLSGSVTVNNLYKSQNGSWYCKPPNDNVGYPAVHIGLNKGGNISAGVTQSIYQDLTTSGSSSKTFTFSTDIDASATGASKGQTVSLQACIFPTASDSGDKAPLTCSAVTPVIIGGVAASTGGTPSGNLPGTPSGNLPGTPSGNLPANDSTTDCKANPSSNNCLYNPLPTDELTTIFLWIANGFLGIVAIWAVIFIIVGGFRMVMAQGNEEAYTTAKKTLLWAVLGLIIAVMSFSIIAIVRNLLNVKLTNNGIATDQLK